MPDTKVLRAHSLACCPLSEPVLSPSLSPPSPLLPAPLLSSRSCLPPTYRHSKMTSRNLNEPSPDPIHAAFPELQEDRLHFYYIAQHTCNSVHLSPGNEITLRWPGNSTSSSHFSDSHKARSNISDPSVGVPTLLYFLHAEESRETTRQPRPTILSTNNPFRT